MFTRWALPESLSWDRVQRAEKCQEPVACTGLAGFTIRLGYRVYRPTNTEAKGLKPATDPGLAKFDGLSPSSIFTITTTVTIIVNSCCYDH